MLEGIREVASYSEIVQTTGEKARSWFLELREHPERYQFESHAGIAFDPDTPFGEDGCRFTTRERFAGFLTLQLHFRMDEVREDRFEMLLERPNLPVWGRFRFEPEGESSVRFTIEIGTTRNTLSAKMIHLFKRAVQQQITAEVRHIKQSMESLV